MKELYKSRFMYLTAGILTSIVIVGGLAMFIAGAVTRQFAVMGVGFGLLFIGFPTCPFCWIAYAACAGNYKLYLQIADGNVRTVAELAKINGITENAVRSRIAALVRKNVIGENAVYGFLQTEGETPEPQTAVTCPSCGATSTEGKTNPTCPYCGRKLI